MSGDYQSILQAALRDLADGDARKAFGTFQPVLSYPGMVKGRAPLTHALTIFTQIATAIEEHTVASLAQAAANDPDNVDALYMLGYELIEHVLHNLAATILARANELAPGKEALLTELVAALGGALHHDEACRMLWANPSLLKQSFLCRYLLAFNSVMIGDLTTARSLLPALEKSQEQEYRPLVERIAGFLSRAEALAGKSPLDDSDLRGWHFVLTGAILLHLSPHGFDQGMHGRYALVQDSAALCLESIQRLKAVLETLQLAIPCVFELPDRPSAILAHAVAHSLHCPLVPWPETGSTEAGLIVAYDLGELDNALLKTLHTHHPDQILWSHASCWSRSHPFAADLTTFQYQFNKSPWNGQMTIDPQTMRMVMSPVDERPVEALATEIIQAELFPNALDDIPTLQAFVQAAVAANDVAILRTEGTRLKQWEGSPVLSSRFY